MLAIGRALATQPAPAAARRADRGPGADHRRGAAGALRGCSARRGLAGIIVEQHAQQDPADHRPRDDAGARPHRASRRQRRAAGRSGAARALPRSHRPVTDLRKFRNFRKNVYSAPALSQHPDNGARHNNAPGLEETMNRSEGCVAPSSRLGRIDRSARRLARRRSCGRRHRAAGEGRRHAVADRLPCADRGDPQDRRRDHGRGDQRPERLLGRPVEYVLLDDQSKPDVARSLYEKLIPSTRST